MNSSGYMGLYVRTLKSVISMQMLLGNSQYGYPSMCPDECVQELIVKKFCDVWCGRYVNLYEDQKTE